jgi:hypothetical protein
MEQAYFRDLNALYMDIRHIITNLTNHEIMKNMNYELLYIVYSAKYNMFTPPYHPPSPLPLKKRDKQIEMKKFLDLSLSIFDV